MIVAESMDEPDVAEFYPTVDNFEIVDDACPFAFDDEIDREAAFSSSKCSANEFIKVRNSWFNSLLKEIFEVESIENN